MHKHGCHQFAGGQLGLAAYCIDRAVATPFSSAGLISAASARLQGQTRREEEVRQIPSHQFGPHSSWKPRADQGTTLKSSPETSTAQLRAVTTSHLAPVPHHRTRVPPLFPPFTAVHCTLYCLAPISPLHGCSSSVAAIDTLVATGPPTSVASSDAGRLCCSIVY